MKNKKARLEALKKTALVFDIETCASYPDGRPIDIRSDFDNYVEYAKVKWFGCYSYKTEQYACGEVKGNEEKILTILNEHNILVGFNNEEFDMPICCNNELMPDKKFLQVDALVILGASSFYRHDGLPFKNKGALMGYEMKQNSLKAIAEAMKLETQKGDIDYKIFFQDEWTVQERADIKKYLKADVQATKEMFDKLWDFWMPFTDWLDEKNILNLSWIRSSVASLTYKCDCHTLGVEETYGEQAEKLPEKMGGNVIEPKYEEIRNIWYLDFTSLYPHIDIMYNIFAEITDLDNWPWPRWHGNDMFQVKGYYAMQKQHPLAVDLAKKIKTRVHLKKTDPDNPLIHTLKIFANSKYGTQRSPIFEQVYTPNAGWDICWLGQQIQKIAQDMMTEFGFETVAGDTDSVFVKLKGGLPIYAITGSDNDERTYVKDCLKTIVNKILDNVPFPCETFNIDIEEYIEYAMWPFDMQPIEDPVTGKNMKNEKGRLIKELKGKKKNYVYIYKKNGDYKLEIKGLPIIKDNATKLGQKILKNILKPLIIKSICAKFSKEFIDNMLAEHLENPDNLRLLAREFKVKRANTYKLESQIQAQISEGYFNGGSGVIALIKNKKIGKAGKNAKYCSLEEAVENKLTIEDIDLEKIRNELKPFIRREK